MAEYWVTEALDTHAHVPPTRCYEWLGTYTAGKEAQHRPQYSQSEKVSMGAFRIWIELVEGDLRSLMEALASAHKYDSGALYSKVRARL